MNFNKHSRLNGQHAFLSPSSYHWINYSNDRLVDRWFTAQESTRGTAMHEYASQEIKAERLSAHQGTLGMFINDAIEFKMESELVLYYSEHCFGTADAISFRRNKLRIHDLKTGVSKTSVHQLEVYSAIFCLEYGIDPFDIKMELRIYQDDEVQIYDGDPEDVKYIMDKIQHFDRLIEQLRVEEAL